MAGEQNPFNNGYNDVLDWLAPTPGYQYGDVLPLRQKVVPYAPGKGPVSPGLPTGLRNLLLGGAELVNSPFTGTFGQNGLAALMALGGSAGLAAPTEGAVSGVFAGRAAKTADTAALARAMSMDSQGAHPQEILSNTGWFKGPKGDWQFEIPDDQANLNLDMLDQFNNGLFHIPLFEDVTLGEVLNHPPLFAAHPDVANIPLKSTGLSFGAKGAYNEPTDTMYLAGAAPDDLLSTILHETQHAIQGRENFPRGASPAMFQPQGFAEEERQFNLENKDFLQQLNDLGLNRYSLDSILTNVANKANKWDTSPWFADQREGYKKLVNSGLLDRAKEFNQKDRQFSAIRDQALEDYQHTAGEVEARTVQARQGYSPAQRAAEPPWVTTQQSTEHNLGILPEDMIFILPNGKPAMIRAGKAYAPKPLDPSLVTKLPGEAAQGNPLIGMAESRSDDLKDLLTTARRLGVDTSNIPALKELEKNIAFRNDLGKQVQARASVQAEIGRKFHENGSLPYPVGARFTTEMSRDQGRAPWQVTGHYVDSKNPERYGYYVKRDIPGNMEKSIMLVGNPFGEKTMGKDAYKAMIDKWQLLTGPKGLPK
jgi:hypothetical protein